MFPTLNNHVRYSRQFPELLFTVTYSTNLHLFNLLHPLYTPESLCSGLILSWYALQLTQFRSHCSVTPTCPGISFNLSTNCIPNPILICHAIWQCKISSANS